MILKVFTIVLFLEIVLSAPSVSKTGLSHTEDDDIVKNIAKQLLETSEEITVTTLTDDKPNVIKEKANTKDRNVIVVLKDKFTSGKVKTKTEPIKRINPQPKNARKSYENVKFLKVESDNKTDLKADQINTEREERDDDYLSNRRRDKRMPTAALEDTKPKRNKKTNLVPLRILKDENNSNDPLKRSTLRLQLKTTTTKSDTAEKSNLKPIKNTRRNPEKTILLPTRQEITKNNENTKNATESSTINVMVLKDDMNETMLKPLKNNDNSSHKDAIDSSPINGSNLRDNKNDTSTSNAEEVVLVNQDKTNIDTKYIKLNSFVNVRVLKGEEKGQLKQMNGEDELTKYDEHIKSQEVNKPDTPVKTNEQVDSIKTTLSNLTDSITADETFKTKLTNNSSSDINLTIKDNSNETENLKTLYNSTLTKANEDEIESSKPTVTEEEIGNEYPLAQEGNNQTNMTDAKFKINNPFVPIQPSDVDLKPIFRSKTDDQDDPEFKSKEAVNIVSETSKPENNREALADVRNQTDGANDKHSDQNIPESNKESFADLKDEKTKEDVLGKTMSDNKNATEPTVKSIYKEETYNKHFEKVIKPKADTEKETILNVSANATTKEDILDTNKTLREGLLIENNKTESLITEKSSFKDKNNVLTNMASNETVPEPFQDKNINKSIVLDTSTDSIVNTTQEKPKPDEISKNNAATESSISENKQIIDISNDSKATSENTKKESVEDKMNTTTESSATDFKELSVSKKSSTENTRQTVEEIKEREYTSKVTDTVTSTERHMETILKTNEINKPTEVAVNKFNELNALRSRAEIDPSMESNENHFGNFKGASNSYNVFEVDESPFIQHEDKTTEKPYNSNEQPTKEDRDNNKKPYYYDNLARDDHSSHFEEENRKIYNFFDKPALKTQLEEKNKTFTKQRWAHGSSESKMLKIRLQGNKFFENKKSPNKTKKNSVKLKQVYSAVKYQQKTHIPTQEQQIYRPPRYKHPISDYLSIAPMYIGKNNIKPKEQMHFGSQNVKRTTFTTPEDEYENLEDFERTSKGSFEEDDMGIYEKVINDMLRTDDMSLIQYDWLSSTVDVRSALDNLIWLGNAIKTHDSIHPYDKELYKYVEFLFFNAKHQNREQRRYDYNSDNVVRNIIKSNHQRNEIHHNYNKHGGSDYDHYPNYNDYYPDNDNFDERYITDYDGHVSNEERYDNCIGGEFAKTYLQTLLALRLLLLPRNRRKKEGEKIQHPFALIDAVHRNLLRDEGGSDNVSDLEDFEEFLLDARDDLNHLHNAINEIAGETSYKDQKFYEDLRHGYLKQLSIKKMLQVVLHLSLQRLFELIENSASNGLERNAEEYILRNKKQVERTAEELKLVLKLVKIIKGIK